MDKSWRFITPQPTLEEKMALNQERVELARAGKNDKVICCFNFGWVVIGVAQPLKAYCLLLANPIVLSINDMKIEERIKLSCTLSACH